VRLIRKYLSSAWLALFGDPVRAFGVVSLILLVVLAIAPRRTISASGVAINANTLR